MPKQVENYILERVLGKGQFGEVFKGYCKLDGKDVAVKTLERKRIQGKFLELLDTEIKVLKQCNNENIIKLYDLKKTANNFYLMLEYCNEGDMMEYLKNRKKLTEQEAVEFLLQILNAFKTLTKYKILHRDFKLANLLLHNGSIKVADFGFSKILDDDEKAKTMLGSPLNMAPEILNNQAYDNKADVWSIGTVFYELLFGKPPYMATNILDLIKNINNQQLQIPKNINNISPVCEDVIRKMLTVDPKNRISFEDLFKHRINTYQEENLKKELEMSIKTLNLSLSMSKFYLKNNMVIDHPSEIEKKKELNEFAIEHAKKNKTLTQEYKGGFVNRPVERKESVYNKNDQQEYKEEDEEQILKNKETQREIQIKNHKRNSNRILHERNIYVFLATVAEESMDLETFKYSELVGFLLVKKMMQMIHEVIQNLNSKKNMYNLDQWDTYIQQKEFKDIQDYVTKEFDVFQNYFEQLLDQVKQNKDKNHKYYNDKFISSNINQNIDEYLQEILRIYIKDILESFDQKTTEDMIKQRYLFIDKLLDCIKIDSMFQFETQNRVQFNFKAYYDENKNLNFQQLSDKIENKIDKILF